METSRKENRIRVEAPPIPEPVNVPLHEPPVLPGFYRVLLFLAFACSAASLYLVIQGNLRLILDFFGDFLGGF